jgi:hypothetical protein
MVEESAARAAVTEVTGVWVPDIRFMSCDLRILMD